MIANACGQLKKPLTVERMIGKRNEPRAASRDDVEARKRQAQAFTERLNRATLKGG